MESFLQKIIDTFYAVGNWIASWFVRIVDGIFIVLKNAAVWVFDALLGVAVSAVQALNVSLPSASSLWSQVPVDVINALGAVGLADAMAIIGSAILVRLGMQLIPFVRLGS